MKQLGILIIGGHPADVFDSAGGTLAHHVKRGDRVTTLALTHGARVHDVVISDTLRFQETMPDADTLIRMMSERAKIKHQEVVEACGVLGITDVRFLTYDDSILTLREDLIQDIARIIREVRPDILITHHPLESGGVADHHAVTGQLALNGLTAALSVYPGDPRPPHRIAQVFFMAIPSGLAVPNCLAASARPFPDVFVDITDQIEAKVIALDKMRSQQYDGAYARKSLEVTDGCFGLFNRTAYAEGFISYWPEVYEYLPLTETRLKWAYESEADTRHRTDLLIAPQVKTDE